MNAAGSRNGFERFAIASITSGAAPEVLITTFTLSHNMEMLVQPTWFNLVLPCGEIRIIIFLLANNTFKNIAFLHLHRLLRLLLLPFLPLLHLPTHPPPPTAVCDAAVAATSRTLLAPSHLTPLPTAVCDAAVAGTLRTLLAPFHLTPLPTAVSNTVVVGTFRLILALIMTTYKNNARPL